MKDLIEHAELLDNARAMIEDAAGILSTATLCPALHEYCPNSIQALKTAAAELNQHLQDILNDL